MPSRPRPCCKGLLDAPPPAIPQWGRELASKIQVSRKETRVTAQLPLKRKTAHQIGLIPNRAEAKQVPAWALVVGLFLG